MQWRLDRTNMMNEEGAVKISSMLFKDFKQVRPFLQGSAGSAGCSAAAEETLQANVRPISARPFAPDGPQGPFHLLCAIPVIK